MNSMEYKISEILEGINEEVKIVKSRDSSVYKFKRDELDYVSMTLNNGLQIMFIEDDLAVTSEVHMSVSTGHNQNPLEFEGLAHFLEHMLFIGSKKYPDTDLYNRLVTESHGSTNAYTTEDHTVYYFTCKSDLIFNILDVFCHFFVDPLLDPKYVDKEITAVDYEHQKNLGSDSYRRWSLIDKFITDKVNSRFKTGDNTTLKKDGIVDALREFYEQYYTIDRMTLVVVHNKVDTSFIDSVRHIFEEIPSKTSDSINELYPVGLNRVNGYEVVEAKRVSDGNEMLIRFFLSDTIKNRKIIDRSYHILSYILNHRGKDSLYKLLVNLELIQKMLGTVGTIYTQDTGYDILLNLTNYGLKNYQSVLMIILAYLNQIRSNSSEIFDTYYDEIHEMDVVNLNTMSRISGTDVADAVIDLHNSYGTDLKFIRVFDVLDDRVGMYRHFTEMMNNMTKDIDLRMKVIIMSNKFEESKLPEIDGNYHTRYLKKVEKFNSDELTRFFDKRYRMPELNPYIPKSIKVLVPIKSDIFVSERTEDMTKIDDPNEFIRLGSNVDNFYHLLKTNNYDSYHAYGHFNILLSSLEDYLDPINSLILEFYVRLVKEAHKPDIFLSSMADSSMNIGSYFRGLVIDFRSFDSSLVTLVERQLNWFFRETLTIDRKTYNRIYKSIQDYLVNYEKSEPYTRLFPMMNDFVNSENTVTNSQLLIAIQTFDPKVMKDDLNEINFNNLQSKALNLMKKGSVRGMIAGSIHLVTAQKIVRMIDSLFDHQREFRIRRIKNKVLNFDQLGSSKTYVEHSFSVKNKNIEDNNIGLSYCIHLGEYVRSEYIPDSGYREIREPLAYYMMSNVIGDRFFNTMRTENELGYYVRAGVMHIDTAGATNIFLKFEIQTQDDTIVDIVRDYVDKELINIIDTFSKKDLDSGIKNMINIVFKDPTNMSDKFGSARYTQSNLTYDELEKVGNTIFLNRLRSLDALNEMKNLTIQYVHSLLKNAIKNRPRYVVMVLPHDNNKN